MSENDNSINKNNSISNEEEIFSASQPTPEIFSDATNRFLNNPNSSPHKVYSASQPEFSSSAASGILKKGRKSFGNGRRVSFAATAHVRVFGADEERRRQKEEEEEQAQLDAFRKQFEVSEGSVDQLKTSFNEFDIKSSPLTDKNANNLNIGNVTPSKRPFNSMNESNQSFDGKK